MMIVHFYQHGVLIRVKALMYYYNTVLAQGLMYYQRLGENL